MFNLPLPGGTTGHALGVTIAAIVLGPSGAILALSIAIAIQALFFGDGGITTLGANCFNMAIVGSLVAYGSYRLIAARRRARFQAARGRCRCRRISCGECLGAAGRRSSSASSPCCFTMPSGTPLYAPYPLSIAIPGDDDRPPDLCRDGGSGDLGRTGRVSAGCRSGTAARHLRASRRCYRCGASSGVGLFATAVGGDCGSHAADSARHSGSRNGMGRVVAGGTGEAQRTLGRERRTRLRLCLPD